MLIMIDSLAERYGMLPSEVMKRADTFDLVVLTAAVAHRNELAERAADPHYVPNRNKPSQEEMLKMLERARKREATK